MNPQIPQLTPAQAADRTEAVLLDVREADEVAEGDDDRVSSALLREEKVFYGCLFLPFPASTWWSRRGE